MNSPRQENQRDHLIESNGRISLGLRFALGGVALGGILLLVTARMLEPDPRGYGTHEQLGLTPCLIQEWTDYACPACGATTAWAYTTRGMLREAVAANGGGTLLALAMPVFACWLLLVVANGKWLIVRPSLPMVLTIGTSLVVIMIIDWCRRTFLG